MDRTKHGIRQPKVLEQVQIELIAIILAFSPIIEDRWSGIYSNVVSHSLLLSLLANVKGSMGITCLFIFD